MEKRYSTFFLLLVIVFTVNALLMRMMAPPEQPKAPGANQQAADEAGKQDGVKRDGDADGSDAKVEADDPDATPEPERWVSIGSLDPNSDYRMAAVFSNRGTALERIDLNNPRYRDISDLENYSGYLGQLQLRPATAGKGATVGVVELGTPAAIAGLKAGDRIISAGGKGITAPADVQAALSKTHAKEQFPLVVRRGDETLNLTAELTLRPLSIVSVEDGQIPSFLLTLSQLDDRQLTDPDMDELRGLTLKTRTWEIIRQAEDEVAFRTVVQPEQIEITKTFRLAHVNAAPVAGVKSPAYHLEFDIRFRNLDPEQPHDVAYQLNGPNGLPTEGWWYANKISPEWWDSAGVRDVVAGKGQLGASKYILVSTGKIVGADELEEVKLAGPPFAYAGVDAIYFSTVLIPNKKDANDVWFNSIQPVQLGPTPDKKGLQKLVNVSFRATSNKVTLKPDGGTLDRSFRVFAGPKQTDILASYNLYQLQYYGWEIFGTVARIMQYILHAFYSVVHNYGIAIILLTFMVRLCMFPLSRKQALGAQKMQELQPEMKRLSERYKSDLEARGKAMQELYRKHNYNPLAGCLPMFIQLPIFLGLYRALSVDIELRQAPLISEGIRWASNLGAPDMLFYWKNVSFLPDVLVAETGWLGPYFNILPCITVVLFLWQQKMFMPPPADEQAALQQKIMRYMMIFMGVMFFRVPSGLCLYFITSSLWGITERKMLPKPKAASGAGGSNPPPSTGTPALTSPPDPSSNGGERKPVAIGSANGGRANKKKRKSR